MVRKSDLLTENTGIKRYASISVSSNLRRDIVLAEPDFGVLTVRLATESFRAQRLYS